MRVFTSNVLIQLLEVHEHTFATPTTELFPSVLAHVTNEGVPMLELEGTNLTRVRIGLVMDLRKTTTKGYFKPDVKTESEKLTLMWTPISETSAPHNRHS